MDTAVPIVQAPMAGGPATPALTAAVSAAGGYGYLAGGYLSAAALTAALDEVRALVDAPFGVNVFVPSPPSDAEAVSGYAARLAGEARRLGVGLGAPTWGDDAYPAKLDVLLAARVHTISFTFGCPPAADIVRVHDSGARAAITVTSVTQARAAARAGADELIVQGTEAGGHQGGTPGDRPNSTPLLELLAQVGATTGLPMTAAGAMASGRDVAAALAAGAAQAALGTALLCADEAGTTALHRTALLERRYDETMLTRAFSGRWARGLANRFAREHSAAAPDGYPEVNRLTRPLRTAAAAAGDADTASLWAGTAWREARAEPAAEIIARVAHALRA